MDADRKKQNLKAFEQYFTVAHGLDIAVKSMPDNAELPDQVQFEKRIPEAFLMSSELAKLSMKAINPLRALSEHAEQLVEFLNIQSQKIDLMMHHIIKNESNDASKYMTREFGGSGVIFSSQEPWEPGRLVELQLFIADASAAIFSVAEVIQCDVDISNDAGSYAVTLLFKRIRSEDVDIIVKAALTHQAEELKQRRQQREKNT